MKAKCSTNAHPVTWFSLSLTHACPLLPHPHPHHPILKAGRLCGWLMSNGLPRQQNGCPNRTAKTELTGEDWKCPSNVGERLQRRPQLVSPECGHLPVGREAAGALSQEALPACHCGGGFSPVTFPWNPGVGPLPPPLHLFYFLPFFLLSGLRMFVEACGPEQSWRVICASNKSPYLR